MPVCLACALGSAVLARAVAYLQGDLLDDTCVLQPSSATYGPYPGYVFAQGDDVYALNNFSPMGTPLYQPLNDDTGGFAKLAPNTEAVVDVLNPGAVWYDLKSGTLVSFDPNPTLLVCETDRQRMRAVDDPKKGVKGKGSISRTIKKRRVLTAGVTTAGHPSNRGAASYSVRYDDVNHVTTIHVLSGKVKVCPRLSAWPSVIVSAGLWLEVGDQDPAPNIHP